LYPGAPLFSKGSNFSIPTTEHPTMARMKPEALRSIHVDGENLQVPHGSLIDDVVPRTVSAISAVDPHSGALRLISREQFRQVVPADFVTHLTPIAKGGSDPQNAEAISGHGTTAFVVTRHAGAVRWLLPRLRTSSNVKLMTHIDEDTVFRPGDMVCGVLPIALAARICAQGARPFAIDVKLPPELRGQELSHEQLEALDARLVEYHVREVGRS
jgi:CRISPR-associated protein Csx16